MKTFSIILSAVALVASGCVNSLKQTVPFDDSAFQWSLAKGTATITGSAFLKLRPGNVKLGTGEKVELVPATPYTKERFQLASQNSAYLPVEARDPRLAKYIKTTLADAQGNFEFKEVPAGDWILSCVIQWQIPRGDFMTTLGDQALAFTSVSGNEVKEVVLTR